MYKIVAFVVVVLAGVFVAPVAASAVPYTPGAQIVASATHLVPLQTTRITAGSGYFGAAQSIHVAVSGTAASDWAVPSHLSSNSAGGTTFTLKAPSSSTGRYTVTVTSSSASGSVVLTVTPKSGSGSTSNGKLDSPGTNATNSNTNDSGLATTGGNSDGLSNGSVTTPASGTVNAVDIQMIIIWALIALLALVLAFIVVARIRRREQTAA